jgi:hypothetical protein
MSNLRTPTDPRAAGAAVDFFLINEDRADLLRAEDEIRGLLTGFFGCPEERLPTAEQSYWRGVAKIGSDEPGGAA